MCGIARCIHGFRYTGKYTIYRVLAHCKAFSKGIEFISGERTGHNSIAMTGNGVPGMLHKKKGESYVMRRFFYALVSYENQQRQVVRLSGKIIVASAVAAERKLLTDMLRRAGFQVMAETTDIGHTLRRIRSLYCDLIIIDQDLDGAKGSKLADIITQDRLAAVILLSDNEVSRLNRPGHYLIKPISSEKVIPAVEAALWYWKRESELRERIRKLEERLETRIVMDKVKGLLIDINGCSESEAHHFIQKEAMNHSLSLRQAALLIAERLIDARRKS